MFAREIVDEYGSYLARGTKYSVLECRGPVRYRQQLASERGVDCYFEAHLNAGGPKTKHGFCIAGVPTPPGAQHWAHAILERVESRLQVRNAGIVYGGPGSGNVRWVAWPAPTLLLEPLFVSDPIMAARLANGGGALDDLATCIVEATAECFPRGGLIGVSKGHLYRGNGDTGAPVAPFDADGDGESDLDPAFDTEGELVEMYVDSFTDQIVRLS